MTGYGNHNYEKQMRGKTGKTIKKHISVMLAVLFLLGVLSLNGWADGPFGEGSVPVPTGFAIERHKAPESVPSHLADGQVWTGKQVTCADPDNMGVFEITLYAWGKTFRDGKGQTQNPLAEGGVVTITDILGAQFEVEGVLPQGVTADQAVLTWEIAQEDILGFSPAAVTFFVKLKTGWKDDTVYYTNAAAAALFTPCIGNPYYYWLAREEIVNYKFDGLSWNNSGGVNRLTITDNDIRDSGGEPLVMPIAPSDSFNVGKAKDYNFNGMVYRLTLTTVENVETQIEGIDYIKKYIFTLSMPFEPAAPGIVYEVLTDNEGGNTANMHYAKTTVFTSYQKTEGFDWVDDDAIRHELPNKGDIKMSSISHNIYVKTWYSDDDGLTYNFAGDYVLFGPVMQGADCDLILKGSLIPGVWTVVGKQYAFVRYSLDAGDTFFTDGYSIQDINGDIYIDRYYKRFECDPIQVTKAVVAEVAIDDAQDFEFELYYLDGEIKCVVATATVSTNALATADFVLLPTYSEQDLIGKILWINELIPENIYSGYGVWDYDVEGMNGKARVNVAANGAVTYSAAVGAWLSAPLTFTNNFYAAAPQITIAKTADLAAAQDGDNIVYAIRVVNSGNVPLSGIELYDSLLKVDLLSGAVTVYAKDSCLDEDRILDFSLYRNLAVGGEYSIFCIYAVQSSDPQSLKNTVTASTDQGAKDEDSALVTVERCQLSLAKYIWDKQEDTMGAWTRGTVALAHGETALYKIVVTNSGNAPSPTLSICDMLDGPDSLSELKLEGGENIDPAAFSVPACGFVEFFAQAELYGLTFAAQEETKIIKLTEIAAQEAAVSDLLNELEQARGAGYEADLIYGEALSELERQLDEEFPDDEAIQAAMGIIAEAEQVLTEAEEAFTEVQMALDRAQEGLGELSEELAKMEAGVYWDLSYVNNAMLGDLSSSVTATVQPEQYRDLRIEKLVKDSDGLYKSIALLENGAKAEFKITVTNTGNTVITAASLQDEMQDMWGSPVSVAWVSGAAEELSPGQHFTAYYESGELFNDSIEEGRLFINTAYYDGAYDTALVVIAPKPAARLSISKKVYNGAGAPDFANGYWLKNAVRYVDDEDETADFYYMVTLKNLGKDAARVDLMDICGSDEVILLNTPYGDQIVMEEVEIAAAASLTFYYNGAAPVGTTVNTASYALAADSNPAFCPQGSSCATAEVKVKEKVVLSVEKTVARLTKNAQGAYVPMGDFENSLAVLSNAPVEFVYKITVTNDSSTTNGLISLSDVFSDGSTPPLYADLSFTNALTTEEMEKIAVPAGGGVTYYVYLELAAGGAMTNTALIAGARDGSMGVTDNIGVGVSQATASVERYPLLSLSKEVKVGEDEWAGSALVYSNDEEEFEFRITVGNSGPFDAAIQLKDHFHGVDITADLPDNGELFVPAGGEVALYYTGRVPAGETYLNDVEIIDQPSGSEPLRASVSATVEPLRISVLSVEKLAAFEDELNAVGVGDPYAAIITRVSPYAQTVVYKITVTNSGAADGLFTLTDVLEGEEQDLYSDEGRQNKAIADQDGFFMVEAGRRRVFYVQAVVNPAKGSVVSVLNTAIIAGAREKDNEDMVVMASSSAKVNLAAPDLDDPLAYETPDTPPPAHDPPDAAPSANNLPAAPTPANDQSVVATDTPAMLIDDGPTPLAAHIPDEIKIMEDDTPLSGLPQTGVAGLAPHMITGLFAAALAALTGRRVRKLRREEKENVEI